MDAIEVKFWWVPQMPMKAFERSVPNVSAGRTLEDAFADYDLFQFENRVKPDYCNTGGTAFRHPELTEGEWLDAPDDEDELADIRREAVERGIDPAPLS